ncbi:helix-turn-helix protein [Actinorugispora endophytica]|uniref:Helix-turn-helix protein n=2 Tax=Actinorugispora endophytica TaxID=1605990 RepID=A0A4R6UXW9_9ACTN|nr:helix-turn-helix domain-containing protein [Actinorugispora endophytica]TDQ52118.1 helix-turn-helix protein [Actinorugispora endophytica]
MTTIGQALASAREEAGCSVQRLHETTRISGTVIRAMERDDFAACGGDFYARGHLRTICRTLGVDAGPLLARFDAEYAEAPAQPRSLAEVSAEGGAAPARAPGAVAGFEADPGDEDATGDEAETGERNEGEDPGEPEGEAATPPGGWLRWAVAAVAIAIAAAVLVWANLGEPEEEAAQVSVRSAGDPAPPDEPRPVQDWEAEQRRAELQAAEAERRAAEAEGDGEVTLHVEVRESTWASVYDGDGDALFAGILDEGESRDWTAPGRLRLHLGDAGSVRLRVNGEDLGVPGDSGEVARLTFDARDPGRG